jgi:tetratricopeptide (TPR) repeat protein
MLVGRAGQACAARNCARAIDLLECVVRAQPGNLPVYYLLGLCYSGTCGFSHPLICPNLAVAYLRRALALLGEDGGIVRATILDALGSALVRGRDASPVAAARTAIECYREAARIYQQCARLDDWARTCFNLGNSLCDLSEMGGEDHWREAVFHYEESLRVRTREKDPERHAAVLENLGSAYRSLSGGAPGDNVKKSIRCYQRALRVYVPASHPDKSAAVENNLGNAYLSLPETDEKTKARNARRALRHFDRALRIQSRDKSSRAYGITQYNRAQANCRLTKASPGGNPKVVATCLEEALAAFQSCGDNRHLRLVRAQLDRVLRQE